ncbi:MAG TPA: magnesium transporter CorA family protein [Candidatus Eremiobacteraeota bacterium]|nr:MAG: CorA-like Mg2+ transporter protein [bacterium ADurb.Bin363]HPZ08015.1 magnesium transporter CorA family protein [Candidatus Eremiobacteraeota bacterium]
MLEIYKTIQGRHSQFIEEILAKTWKRGKIHSTFFGQIFYIEGEHLLAVNFLTALQHIFSVHMCRSLESAIIKDDIGTRFLKLKDFTYGSWINIFNPTEQEIIRLSHYTNLSIEFIKSTLDEEERPRIDSENGYSLILIHIPVENSTKDPEIYKTIPLGILISEQNIITICLQDNSIIRNFIEGKVKTFYTFKKTRFLFQLLYKISIYYLQYLRNIDKISDKIEKELHKSLRNQELIELFGLEKTLVYFSTSLKGNEIVLGKILKFKFSHIKMYPDDTDLLEDVITETKQAIDMTKIYTNILRSTRDAYASMISNNLNVVMKFLAAITIILAIPTMISSFFGMNVVVPLPTHPHGFIIIIIGSLVLSIIGIIILWRKNML